MTDSSIHPFESLTPDFIMDAVESLGYWCDGRTFALNSYENRVYQVGIEDGEPLIAKFYRPGRWTDEQILEEHEFSAELAEQELPVVIALSNDQGRTLFEHKGFSFSIFPRRGGRAPELDNLDNLYQLGRLLGRFHLIGAQKPFIERPKICIQSYGYESVALISGSFIPSGLKQAYDTLTADLLNILQQRIDEVGPVTHIRVHGDCHSGNMLWRDDAPHFVDFDDARMAPAIQDIWMLLCGSRENQTLQLSEILDGYREFYDFDMRELHLLEVMRTLRMLQYTAWLARRWEDPAFPRSFTWFNTERYWSEHILELREQFSSLQEPVLQVQ